jgi:ethanolaminephosphotransferase
MLIPHLLIEWTTSMSGNYSYEDSDGEVVYPAAPNRFLIFLFGIGLFAYNTLDNMDGKQARKIGASSPLGLIMDHGCDSVNAFIQSMTIGRIFMVGNAWTALAIVFPVTLFWLATYEQ